MNKTLYNIILHLLLVGAVIFGINQCSDKKDVQKQMSDKSEIFNKANEILTITLDSDSNKVTKSKPHEELLSDVAINTKNLLDSVSESRKLPSNERITKYHKVPIESSITLKAKEVNSDYAYAENGNWYSRYSFRDSIFDLKYKTVYESIITEKDYKVLGINYKPKTTFQHDWIKDTEAPALKPTTVIIKDDSDKRKFKFELNNVNKFRSIDNAVLTGLEAGINFNRVNISGQYNYNINKGFNSPNSNFNDNTEYEISLKYKILK